MVFRLVYPMDKPTRRPNTFYIDELHQPCTVGNYAEVERVIRSTFTGQQGIDDDVIHGFIQKMRRCQRRLVRKPCNGRLRAIVYTWSTPSSDVVRISYGMCTFTDRTGRGSYRKRDLRQTALKRFLQCGTTIDRPVTQPAYYHRSTRRYVEQLITEAIHDTVRSGAPLL